MTGSKEELLSLKEGWPSLPLLLAKESPKAAALAWSREPVKANSYHISWHWGTLKVHVPTACGATLSLFWEKETPGATKRFHPWSQSHLWSVVYPGNNQHPHPDPLQCIISALHRDERIPSKGCRTHQWRLKVEREKSDLHCIVLAWPRLS